MASVNLPPTETLRAEDQDCLVTVTASYPAAAVLRLYYQFESRSMEPIYLLNQLWDTIGTDKATGNSVFMVSPNRVNVQVGAQVVMVSKAVVDVPIGMLVEVRHIPCLTLLAPGATLAETIELPLPLVPYTPYTSEPAAQETAVLRALQVEFGYVRSTFFLADTLRPIASATGAALYLPAFPAKQQALVTLGPFQAPVEAYPQALPYPPKPTEAGKWTPWSS